MAAAKREKKEKTKSFLFFKGLGKQPFTASFAILTIQAPKREVILHSS